MAVQDEFGEGPDGLTLNQAMFDWTFRKSRSAGLEGAR